MARTGELYDATCRQCGCDFEAAVTRDKRKTLCPACKGPRTDCATCGGALEPNLIFTCSACRKAKGAARDRRKREARIARYSAGARVPTAKRCPSCGIEKPADAFHRQACQHDGLSSRCAECVNGARQARLSTPEGRLSERIRRQLRADRPRRRIDWNLRRALRGQRVSRSLEAMFGYSLDDLRHHLERQFQRGMTWDRFMAGEIHIDHIRPVSSFDLSDPDEVRACYALPNLRPAWARDNLSKGAARTHLI